MLMGREGKLGTQLCTCWYDHKMARTAAAIPPATSGEYNLLAPSALEADSVDDAAFP